MVEISQKFVAFSEYMNFKDVRTTVRSSAFRPVETSD